MNAARYDLLIVGARVVDPASGLDATRDVAIAGKTGSLADRDPFRDYSWFVGFAPADRPQIVVASVVVNGRLWRVRAPQVARDALEAYFTTRLASVGGGAVREAAAR